MPTLEWSDALSLAHPAMDQTHLEFVHLLAECEAAFARAPAEGLSCYEALVEHTVGHFGQEDRWMTATGFAPENCHSSQHTQVLALMQEVRRLARERDDFGPLERMLPALGPWFVQHAQTMDAGLASHLDQMGFDPSTGQCSRALAEQPLSGCGGTSCSPAAADA